MDLSDMRNFKTIADCGSLSKAAAHLRIAQPALSRKIQKMEHSLGVRLLRRDARGVSPTEAGEVLLRRATTIENDLEEMRLEMARYAERATGVLRVAVQSPLSLTLAPELLKAYRASHPGVTLELTEGFSGDLLDSMLAKRLDLAITDMPTHPHVDFNFAQLWVEPLRLVGPAGGIIARKFGAEPVPLREIAALPIIMPSQRHGIRRFVDAAFERQHIRLRPMVEANGAMMIMQLVKAGFGYSILSTSGVYPWVVSGELEAAPVRPTIRRTMSLITRTALLDDKRVAPLRELVLALAPGIANQERFGRAALFLAEKPDVQDRPDCQPAWQSARSGIGARPGVPIGSSRAGQGGRGAGRS